MRLAPSPPPAQQLRVTTGIGYVQGADWGAHLAATGRVGRFWMDVDSLVTASGRDTTLERGRWSLGASDGRWTLDAGDFVSPLAGPGRGVRVAWDAPGSRRTTLSYLVPALPATGRTPIGTYRDAVTFGTVARLDASIATSGAHMAQARARLGRTSIEGTYRRLTGGDRDVHGAAELRTWRGIALRGSVTRTHHDNMAELWRFAAVRIPISTFLDITIERTFGTTPVVRRATWTTLVHVATGALQLTHRQQWGSLAYDTIGFSEDRALRLARSSALYRAGSQLRLALQMTGDWTPEGRLRQWEELEVTWRPVPGMTASVAAAFPGVSNAGRARARLSLDLPQSMGLDVEFGRPSPYQLATATAGTPRLRVLVRRRWVLPTPQAPRSVAGLVVDQIGRPIGGVRVRLGRYSVDTDADGRFVFAEVAAGAYDLALDSSTIPADYGWNGQPLRLDVRAGTTLAATLEVAPLDTITGRVCLDADRDGRCGPDDGLPGIALRLDGSRTTSTDELGRFAFHNLWPGPHRIEIESASLGSRYLPIGRLGADVTLRPGLPATGVTFHVAPRARPVQWSGLNR